MRVEANVSLRPRGTEPFGIRVEVKNMNSFRSVERAIAFEIERQAAALDAGETLTQDTRGWNEDRGTTYVMRSKEDSHDYRYFPEPDLPPLRVDASWMAAIRAGLPELPAARRARYEREFGLSGYEASVLVSNPDAARLFEETSTEFSDLDRRVIANWTIGEYLRQRNESGDEAFFVSGRQFGDLIKLVVAKEISATNAKDVLARHISSGEATSKLAQEFTLISDATALAAVVDEVIAANPKAVDDYRAGKPVLGFFVGQVMKATRGQANAGLVQETVRQRLDGGSRE
jgi:aspartyl-tRNA(Asn)/glutamyl-tRNA(Gln) amidotransferase subunit B